MGIVACTDKKVNNINIILFILFTYLRINCNLKFLMLFNCALNLSHCLWDINKHPSEIPDILFVFLFRYACETVVIGTMNEDSVKYPGFQDEQINVSICRNFTLLFSVHSD